MPSYPPVRQSTIVTACCVIHNFILIYRGRDSFFDSDDEEEDSDSENEEAGEDDLEGVNMSNQALQQMTTRRDQIAIALWNAY